MTCMNLMEVLTEHSVYMIPIKAILIRICILPIKTARKLYTEFKKCKLKCVIAIKILKVSKMK